MIIICKRNIVFAKFASYLLNKVYECKRNKINVSGTFQKGVRKGSYIL